MGRRDANAAGHRHARIVELMFEELRTLVCDEASDPALDGIGIVCVALSVDYRHARVHFVTANASVAADVVAALERATPYLRSRLGAEVELKRTPELRFVWDGVAERDEDATCSPTSREEDA